jgi:hypothetical protein
MFAETLCMHAVPGVFSARSNAVHGRRRRGAMLDLICEFE